MIKHVLRPETLPDRRRGPHQNSRTTIGLSGIWTDADCHPLKIHHIGLRHVADISGETGTITSVSHKIMSIVGFKTLVWRQDRWKWHESLVGHFTRPRCTERRDSHTNLPSHRHSDLGNVWTGRCLWLTHKILDMKRLHFAVQSSHRRIIRRSWIEFSDDGYRREVPIGGLVNWKRGSWDI
jgi:hypothetical protein